MKRKENDYLPCKEYLADGIEDNDGFVLFQNSKTKLYYFVLKKKRKN